jgi:hypothetical protein
MRIFLTGGTGYIGSAVLEALQRGGHEVTTLVRDPKRPSGCRGGAARGSSATSCPVELCGGGRGCRRHRAHRDRRTRSGPRRWIGRRSIPCSGAPAAPPGPPGGARLHVGHLGARRHPGTRRRIGAAPPDAARGLASRARAARARGPRHPCGRRAAGHRVRRRARHPGDMLKDAANGLVRVVGDGRNHWPCIYDRDLADLYLRLVNEPGRVGYLPRQRRGGRARGGHRGRARTACEGAPGRPPRAARGGAREDGPLCRRARPRSDRAQSPRARPRMGAHPALGGGNIARLLEEFRAGREAA